MVARDPIAREQMPRVEEALVAIVRIIPRGMRMDGGSRCLH